jgi:hypothetical protein
MVLGRSVKRTIVRASLAPFGSKAPKFRYVMIAGSDDLLIELFESTTHVRGD